MPSDRPSAYHPAVAESTDTVTAGRRRARVILFRIHVAMALGGKGLCLMTGSVADVRAGVQAASQQARRRGLLVSEIVIPRPSRELFAEYL